MEAIDKVGAIIDQAEELTEVAHPFYAFEPWDVERRDEWVRDQALKDGIDLYEPNLLRYIKEDPHTFQTGFILSKKFSTFMLAGSRVGKSYPSIVKIIIMLTGEVPISLRYEKGFNTGIKRKISEENIIRFGRRDSKTGRVIDHALGMKRPEAWNEWDCGNITGAGIFPSELICPPGSEIRIGTYQKAKQEFWWPRLVDDRKLFIPEHLIDKRKNANKLEGLVYLTRNSVIAIITYEMHANRFEAEEVPYTVLDEEPMDEKIIATVVTHTRRWTLQMSPYNGITYTKDLFFPKNITDDSETFHSTAYDSPYVRRDDIARRRSQLSIWEIGARLWGIPTALKGSPFFDRAKIMKWISRYSVIPFTYATFEPDKPYFGLVSKPAITAIPGLIDTPVSIKTQSIDNKINTWRVYEQRQPGVAYVMAVDPAEGNINPDEVGDWNAAIIMRPADEAKDEKKQVIVATIRSTAETIPFARICAHALRYFNNALLAPETKGSYSATLCNELKEWPYWYMHTTTQDKTEKQRQKPGFDTVSEKRDMIFEQIKEWIADFTDTEYPYIPDDYLLKELAEAEVSETRTKKRCDHPEKGSLDLGICFGILLYVFKNASDQIRCNVMEEVKTRKTDPRHPVIKQNALCNLALMGYRRPA